MPCFTRQGQKEIILSDLCPAPGDWRRILTIILPNSCEMKKSKILKSLDQRFSIFLCIRMASWKIVSCLLSTNSPLLLCLQNIFLWGWSCAQLKTNKQFHIFHALLHQGVALWCCLKKCKLKSLNRTLGGPTQQAYLFTYCPPLFTFFLPGNMVPGSPAAILWAWGRGQQGKDSGTES